ncbi:MAG: hypothetical protein LBT05_04310 [Planctomycetaceae bacterium]|jgi:hypothetical protein|nr:hypothetical protein [Planctomycetaceae bacterium]
MSNQETVPSPESVWAILQETARMSQEYKKQTEERFARWEAERAEREAERKKAEAERETKREAERAEREAERKKSEKAWEKRFGWLTDKIGEIIEAMVEGDILGKFEKLGYHFTGCTRRYKFKNNKLDIRGEIDFFLEDGDTAMLVEVKTTLEIEDVKYHLERMKKYRRYADAKGDKRTFIAAVAGGAVVSETVREFAHQNGMYVIVQSGDAVRIVKPPKGFKVKEW